MSLVLRRAGGGSGRGTELLFIRRAENPRDPWSGHMAFPGGRQDRKDADLYGTAVRETAEEVGLDLRAAATPMGRLAVVHTVAATDRPMAVSPFLFRLRDTVDGACLQRLRPNDEVAATFWIDLAVLRAGTGRGTMPFTWKGAALTLPCVRLQGQVIWGLTLRMVDDLLHRLGQAPVVTP